METLTLINKKLEEKYGRHVFRDTPIFRLVFSNTQLEHRKGLFGPLAVKEEVKEVPKYNYVKDAWVLEKYIFIGHQPELVNVSGYSYEPIWVFRDSNDKPIQPNYRAVEMLVDLLLYGERVKFTAQYWKDQEDKQIEKEYQENLEILGDKMRSYSTEVVNRE
jgi:hypothetical protein